ncbi:MAG: HEAT repeat domain-containing protein [Oligosphaeraceae bacterium]
MLTRRLASLFAGSALLAGSFLFAGTPAEDLLATTDKSVEALVTLGDKAENTPHPKGGKPTLNPVAYEAICLAYADATFIPTKEYYRIAPCNASKALDALRKNYLLPRKVDFIPRLLAHPAPTVRAYGIQLLGGGILGRRADAYKLIQPLLETEKEPGVQAALIRHFAIDAHSQPAIAAFLLRMLSGDDPQLRACATHYTCNASRNAQAKGLPEKIATLIVQDPDENVRAVACEFAGNLGLDLFAEPLAKVLAGDNDRLRARALKSAINLWWNFPFFSNHSEAGYRLTLKTLPEIAKVQGKPDGYYHVALSQLTYRPSTKSTADKWAAAAASWYKSEELQAALLPLLHAKQFSFIVTNNIIKSLYAHGWTKEQLTAEVEKLKAEGVKDFSIQSYTTTIEKLK